MLVLRHSINNFKIKKQIKMKHETVNDVIFTCLLFFENLLIEKLCKIEIRKDLRLEEMKLKTF